jgi:NAD(P)-dependent dehydrogenase (short-subunit alcohol dehydrogenase family)
MEQKPQFLAPQYQGSGKLKDKVAVISGADSGIGRSVAILFAREGANVVIAYKEQHKDAEKTKSFIEKEGTKCLLVPGDLGVKQNCQKVIDKTIETFGKLDILVNHAGIQYVTGDLQEISEEQLEKIYRTNVYSAIFLTQCALPHLKSGAAIINTTSITAFRGHPNLVDYSSSKGAIQTLTYSLASQLVSKGIRVNAVAPGPIWTPFIPSSFPPEKIKHFGQDTLMGRAGQPEEVSPAYVFLACNACSSYITGQTIHINGGNLFS